MAGIIRHWVMCSWGVKEAPVLKLTKECFFYNVDEMKLSFEDVSAKNVLAKMKQPFAGCKKASRCCTLSDERRNSRALEQSERCQTY